MNKKGISSIIATLLMLIITMTLTGTAWIYMSGVLTSKISSSFFIIDISNGVITIKNDGTTHLTSITTRIDDNLVNTVIIPNIGGLVGYWSFNEGSDSIAYDSSGNNNHGTLYSGAVVCSGGDCPNWIDGKYGKALSFDGVNDYVKTTSVPFIGDVNQPYTFEVWVKVAPGETYGNIIHMSSDSDGGGWCLPPIALEGSKFRGYSWPPTSVYGTTTSQSDKWYYVVNTWDPTSGLRIYVNGVLEGQASQSAYSGSGVRNYIWFGFTPSACIGDTGWFAGTIDEIKIYNRALSAEEISSLALGLVSPGQSATVKTLTSLSKGNHIVKLCTPSMCQKGILTIV